MELLTGTNSHDTLDVSGASAAYEIQGFAGHDVILGSAYGDLIVGGPGADQMSGNAGDDVFLVTGSDSFADIINGGAGSDTLSGGAGDDIILIDGLISVERIDGGGGIDVLRGTDGGTFWDLSQTVITGIREIDGRGGADQITGSSGNDRIIGGADNDLLVGGAGTDVAVFSGIFSLYSIINLGQDQFRVETAAYSDGSDTVSGFEALQFADGTFANGTFTPRDPANTADPVATTDSYTTAEDMPLVVAVATGVLANDTDADGDSLSIASYSATSVHGGTVALNPNGSFTYTPAFNFNGADSFSYIVTDGRGGNSNGIANVAVSPVSDAPLTSPNNYSVGPGKALVMGPASGVLANDTDPDGDFLTVVSFDAVSAHGGWVKMNPDGSFVFTPAPGYFGSDSFSYAASDGSTQTSATVSVTTSPESAPPSAFETIIFNMPEHEWAKLNINQFQDVWTPAAQRPVGGIGGIPKSVIECWSAATWDDHRNDYIFWGGGHANYDGNEVYTWSATTLQWERSSLPSAVTLITGAQYETADGYLNAPISSHGYDNLEYLQVADRMINFGGAGAHSGAGFVETDGVTKTGPYLWDPAKADANKVGGLTGSQVNPVLFPDVVGGEMWENRNTWNSSDPRPRTTVNGTTDYARINGVDVVFVEEYSYKLFTYTIPDVNDPSKDRWEVVGTAWDTYDGLGAGAYDSSLNIYLRTAGTEFVFWDLNHAGPDNRNISFIPTDPTGQFVLDGNWGVEYDPVRDQFVLWNGDGAVWYLHAPNEIGATGWTVEKALAPSLTVPTIPELFRGVLGKWDYVAAYDIFVGVTDQFTGDVWAYKPGGWTFATRNGDSLANLLTGNVADNTLNGWEGNDTLDGASGNDTLDGGTGNDSLAGGTGDDWLLGGAGDDSFNVDSLLDFIVENAGQGTDTVTSSVALTLAANIENLVLSGVAAINGTGNGEANTLTGNSGNNVLSGLAGNDTLIGGPGDDNLNGGSGNDTATFSGIRSLYTITGGAGNYTVNSAAEGTDTLTGIETLLFADGTLVPGVKMQPDVNGDGKTDIIFRNNVTGALYSYQMNGTAIAGEGFIARTGPAGWQVIETRADFSGDGKTDVLWWNPTTHSLYNYLLNGNLIASEGFVTTNVPVGWDVVGTGGDYNGDGKADILWKSSANATYIYLMNGTAILGQGFERQGIGSDWSIQESAGDYNGDGKSDILWRNGTTGALYIDQINGTGIQSEGYVVASVATEWQVVDGKADYNGDGKSDILWWNPATRSAYAYLMNDKAILSEAFIVKNLPAGWAIAETRGDYNGDGKADILWTNSANATYIYLMNGLAIQGQGYERQSIAAGWQLADAIGDTNGDGRSDIVWHNSVTGGVYVDLVSNFSIIQEGFATPSVPLDWAIV